MRSIPVWPRVIARLRPDVLAVEDVFHGKNARSALVLGHVRGVVLLAGADAGLPVSAFPPATVKVQVTGFGRAEKAQVAMMVSRILGPRGAGGRRRHRRPGRRPLPRPPPQRETGLLIAHLRGRVLRKSPQEVIVDVAGVGYRVAIPVSTFYQLGEEGAEVSLRVHTHVREDALALFGFLTAHEQDLFERLIQVAGVGPKLAVNILSGIEAAELAAALRGSDIARLTRVPGVGKKTAERLIVELKDKMPPVPAAASEAEIGARLHAEGRPPLRPRPPGLLARGGRARRGPGAARGRHGTLRGPPAPRAADGLRRGPVSAPGEPPVTEPRIVSSRPTDDDIGYDQSLRPRALDEYVGQPQVVANLRVAIEAAKARGEALDHVLLFGPPGVGKTSLAHVIATELGVPIKATAGPIIERAGDLAALLTALDTREVIFIDEIHRLDAKVEEILYPALEDSTLDLMIGTGPGARSMKIPLKPFTLVAATTRAGLLTAPLRGRFGIVHRLDFYSEADLHRIVTRSARILGVPMEADGAAEIARRSRGTPRIANRLLRRVRDFAEVRAGGVITAAVARDACALLEVDEHGFDEVDRKLLLTIIDKFGGGPVGVGALAAAISEETDAIEDIYEPYLLQIGFIDRTPRGRTATRRAYEHFGRVMPEGGPGQRKLF